MVAHANIINKQKPKNIISKKKQDKKENENRLKLLINAKKNLHKNLQNTRKK